MVRSCASLGLALLLFGGASAHGQDTPVPREVDARATLPASEREAAPGDRPEPAARAATSVPNPLEPLPPRLTALHREFLSRVARRTIRDAVLGRAPYAPGYVPAELDELRTEALVRFREGGYLLAAAAGGPVPVALAVRDAALGAFQSLRAERSRGDGPGVDLALVNSMLVEIEIIGSAEPIAVDADWTQPRVIDPFIEPGIHGMVLLGPRKQHRFCPTELFTSDMTLAQALQDLTQTTHSDPSEVPKTKLLRFRTVHWYEPASGGEIVSLQRGLTVLPPAAVTAAGLDQAIERLAEYMCYRQKASGLFTYQYEPALDVYSDDDNLVRQVGATLAMAMHAKWSGRGASLAAADTGIRHHLQGLSAWPADEEAAFIATADRQNKLGVTALLALALREHPDAPRYTETRKRLVRGILRLQRPSGMFLTAFPPAGGIEAQDYFPGEALLALARQYDDEPSGEILEAFDRAIRYYREYFRAGPSPAFMPWQVQAYAAIAQHTKRKDYVEYVFELTDWLAQDQLTASNCPWPELWGGIASYQTGRAGVATAAYLEGFADALTLARRIGDAERGRRYEAQVRGAARFVMQLQVRPEEAYFVRSPQDAVGGVRTAPALNLLRIDHCQHALIALVKARQVLSPP
ncbi:MAG: hypothetical protein HY763_13015 [Planctomycetes bacterium]|nr:hypothetical protein [Planctomycetota bacterium]